MKRWIAWLLLLPWLLAGCGSTFPELCLNLDNYGREQVHSLEQLEQGQLVVYCQQNREIAGKILNIKREGFSLIVDPEGNRHNELREKALVFIFDGKQMHRLYFRQDDLPHLYWLQPIMEDGAGS